jgi:hypothetical protein
MLKTPGVTSSAQKSTLLSFIVCSLFVSPFSSLGDPKPGDIFREYHFADGHGVHLCPQGAVRDSAMFTMRIDDLKGAIKAELTGLFHTGHIGTSERMLRINDGKAFDLPSADIPAANKECYFTYIFGRPSVEVPLADLREGENNMKLFVGPQVCHGFNWPCYGFHSLVLRVYYDETKPHPTGEIEYPREGHVITTDELMIKTKVRAAQAAISSVDIVGYYYDYPLEGSGKYLDWHYLIDEYGRWFGLINRNMSSPYHETWNMAWLPDQEQPMKLMARVTDTNGMSYMTAAIGNLRLKRENHSVTMYKTVNVPENFKVRVKETMKSRFEPIADLTNVSKVQMVSIIPVGHMENKYSSVCGINDKKLKQYGLLPDLHSDFFYNTYLDVSPNILKTGINEFFVYSDTDGHMTEVCWPGPALLVRREFQSKKGTSR